MAQTKPLMALSELQFPHVWWGATDSRCLLTGLGWGSREKDVARQTQSH